MGDSRAAWREVLARRGVLARPDEAPEVLAARQDLTAFSGYLWHRYQRAAHLDTIAAALEDVARYVATGGREGTGNLLVELPPRHGKSFLVARLFPAWLLGRLPDARVILASYGETLASKHSRFVRNLMRAPRYRAVFPGVRLADDSQARDAWDLAAPHEGGMDAVGVGSGVTGKGAHLVITDDLVKSRAEAESVTQRENTWDWLQDDLLTRKEPGAAHVAIGTRWHTDDVHGRLKRLEGDLWRVIRLPALAEPGDPLDRAEGAALWPARFGGDELRAIRRRMGDYSFNALYQQAPVAAEGGLFKRDAFQVIDGEPADVARAVRFWDLALSAKTTADYTVGVLLGQTDSGATVVLDVARAQLEWDTVVDWIARIAQGDGPGVAIGIEQAGYMTRAVQDLLTRDAMHRFSVTGYPVDRDKVTRALPYAARVGAGLVYVLRRAWTEAYLDELASFPRGVHDDQVDASAGAYQMLDEGLLVDFGAVIHDDDRAYHIGSGAY